MLSVLLGQLEDDPCLYHWILEVWEDEHELVVVGDVEVLVERLLTIVVNFYHDPLFLDQELRVLMDQEWSEVLHFPLGLVDTGRVVEIKKHLLHLFVLTPGSTTGGRDR